MTADRVRKASRFSWRKLAPFATVVLFLFALALLHRELAHFRYRDIRAAMASLPSFRLLAALLLTAASYLTLTGYDTLGLLYLKVRLPYRRIALAAFVSYAFSNTLGHPLLTGTPIRVRLYAGWGLSGLDLTRLVAFGFLTFWIGFLTLGGGVLLVAPPALPPGLHLPFARVRPIGVLFLGAVLAYLALVAIRRKPLAIRGTRLPLPGLPLALGQIAVSALDWCLAGSVLYVLIAGHGGITLPHFLGVFLLAQQLGILSQVPGGLGVFETAIVLLLSPQVPAPAVLAALVVFRGVYYFLPLLAAALLLGTYELGQRRAGVARWARVVGARMPAVVPQILSVTTFLGGVVLLVSGATPAIPARLVGLARFLPLPVIEFSHFLGSLAGVALLLLAVSLQRRLDAAYHLALALLSTGIVVSLLKGLDYEEALLLSLMLVALLPCRAHFHRRAALTAGRFTPGWVAAIAIVLLGVTWLGFFSYKHVEYAHSLFWEFTLRGNAPRFLRATVGVVAVALGVALARLLRPASPRPAPPGEADLERASAIAARSPRTYAYLGLLGDKQLLFPEAAPPGEDGFLMYGVAGRSWVALGDPVGPEEVREELAWRFRELVDEYDGWAVFYQVSEAELHLYVDLGLSLIKLGEEARVPLAGFSLEGRERRKLRHAWRRVAELGYRFEVAPAAEVPALLPELERVSNEWLADKSTREKSFSLGSFEPRYLRRFPLALVRGEEGIVAFANLWLGTPGQEMSVDLMRHTAGAPPGMMDYLFLELMLWGREHGYHWLNLGMAPLSGLAGRAVVPLWNRLGTLLFRHGEPLYHFQGLRHYKDKFAPVWEARYLAYPGGLALPRVLADIATLIAGGWRGVLMK